MNSSEMLRETSRNSWKTVRLAEHSNHSCKDFVHSEWTDNPVWVTRRENPGIIVRAGTWGEGWWDEFPENWPKPNEYVLVKHRWSGFHATELDLVLRSKKFETIILVGVSSAGCVDATAKDGFMLGYGVIVLSNCTWAKTRESHEASLRRLDHHHGIVASSEEVLEVLALKATNSGCKEDTCHLFHLKL